MSRQHEKALFAPLILQSAAQRGLLPTERGVIEMSKAGSPSSQIRGLEMESGYLHINDGSHKEDARQELKDGGLTDFHEVSKHVGFYESKTLEKYNGIYKQYLRFEKAEGRPCDLRAFTADKADAFLQMKWDEGRSSSTMLGYCKAFAKLEGMLETVSKDWGEQHTTKMDDTLKSWRAEANDVQRPVNEQECRAYNAPQAVVDAIQDPRAYLAASLQLETGLRVHDVTFIRLNADNTLDINSKAGYRVAHFPIPGNLAAELRQFGAANMQADGSTKFNLISYGDYRSELKAAAESCGERYTGTHALRASFAVNLYNELRTGGKRIWKHEKSLQKRYFTVASA